MCLNGSHGCGQLNSSHGCGQMVHMGVVKWFTWVWSNGSHGCGQMVHMGVVKWFTWVWSNARAPALGGVYSTWYAKIYENR